MTVTRQAIVDETIALLKQGGLEALSLRKLAARLNISAPTLYWHVASKRELLDLVAEELVRRHQDPLRPGPAPGQTCWQWLRTAMCEMFTALIATRDAPRVLAGNRPGLDSLPYIDGSLGALRAAGFSATDAQQTLFTLGSYVIGSAIEWQAEADRESQGVGVAPDVIEAITSDRFPNLSAAARGVAEQPPNATFEFGLDLIIDGLRARYPHVESAEDTASARG